VRNLQSMLARNMASNVNPVPPVEDNAFMLLRTQKQKVAVLHASWTEWKNKFSFEIFGQKGFLTVQGLGGHYGPERLIAGVRRAEGGPPQIEEFTFTQSPESGRATTAQGKDDRRNREVNSRESALAPRSYWDSEW